MALSVNLIH